MTYLNGNCFYPPPSPASAFQYFVGNTSWGVGGGVSLQLMKVENIIIF